MEFDEFDDATYQHPERHTYTPDDDGRCTEIMPNGRPCGSRQRSSVLHVDAEADFRQRHSHGGGDCMCFEDPNGPSFYEAMAAYVKRVRS